MTTQAAFTPEEWDLLQQTLYEPGLAIMIAAPGGMIQESFAIIQGMLEADDLFPNSELVHALLSSQASTPGAKPEDTYAPSTSAQGLLDEFLNTMIAHLRQAVKIVTTKATPSELEDYQRLVLFLAEKVANAASEGGLLGLGGERVTEAERRVLDEMKLALRRKT